MNVEKKIKNMLQKKSRSVFEGFEGGPFEHTLKRSRAWVTIEGQCIILQIFLRTKMFDLFFK